MSKVTINSVARLAGVSKQTVSRVLNNHPNVSEETRKQVKSAIRQLNYTPSNVARRLALRDAVHVGVVSPSLSLYGPGQIVRGIEAACRERGYFVSLTRLDDHQTDPGESLKGFFGQSLDALILVDVDDHFHRNTQLLHGVAHVITDPLGQEPGGDWAGGDRQGVRSATEYLMALGHRRIAHIGGPISWPSARSRERGWRDALEKSDLVPGPVIRSPWSAQGGFSAAQQLLVDPRVTAVVAASDEIALGVLAAYARAGREIPHDISVVGFDGTASSEFYQPALTTVACDFQAFGEQYVDALDVVLGRPVTAKDHVLTHLVVRDSTARLPGSPELSGLPLNQ